MDIEDFNKKELAYNNALKLADDMYRLNWGNNACDLIEFCKLRRMDIPDYVCYETWKRYRRDIRQEENRPFDIVFFAKDTNGGRRLFSQEYQEKCFALEDAIIFLSFWNNGNLQKEIDGKIYESVGFLLNGEVRHLERIKTTNCKKYTDLKFHRRYDIYIHYGNTCWNKGWQQTKEYCMSEIGIMAKDPKMAGHIIELYDLDEEEPVVRIVL